jgi:hypothetical protein
MATPFRLEQDLVQVHRLRDVLRRPAELPRRAEITVASYNVHNVFGESAQRPKSDEQLDALGEMILKLNADIISFAEVFSSPWRLYCEPLASRCPIAICSAGRSKACARVKTLIPHHL